MQQDKYSSTSIYLKDFSEVLNSLDTYEIDNAIKQIKLAWRRSSKIFTCGNGGSAITASHYINDWVKSVNYYSKEKKFRGFSFTDNIGLITAYANDINYEDIYKEQCKALIEKDDLLVVVSASGNSKNIIKAVKQAKKMGAITLGILGFDGGEALKIVDFSFTVPSFDMQICEDIHHIFGHMTMKSLVAQAILDSKLIKSLIDG